MRLGADVMTRRRFFDHPCGDAGDRSVGLRNDHQFDAAIGESPGDEHRLAASRMKRIVDPPLDRVVAGSMCLFRATPGSRECRRPVRAGGSRNCAAAYAEKRAWRCPPGSLAAVTARLSCRAVTGLIGFWPGNSQACGRAARHHSRKSSSSRGDSITVRSLLDPERHAPPGPRT